MVEREVAIVNRLGLHARPAAQLVQKASKFESEIKLKRQNLEVNAKSIMGVMMLAAEMGSKILIIAEGPDEREAVEALAQVVQGKFGEE
ncbi:MAG: phosphocarrier protein HPr [candidate division Zixibacteria bacterium RBG_16_53_22]|nr:MAG: phosphocarrier protein HPr [candidate division Zixibacteria bacterium RBG_16_53_22]